MQRKISRKPLKCLILLNQSLYKVPTHHNHSRIINYIYKVRKTRNPIDELLINKLIMMIIIKLYNEYYFLSTFMTYIAPFIIFFIEKTRQFTISSIIWH